VGNILAGFDSFFCVVCYILYLVSYIYHEEEWYFPLHSPLCISFSFSLTFHCKMWLVQLLFWTPPWGLLGRGT